MLRTLLSLKLRIMRSAMSGSPAKLIFGFGFLVLSGFGSIYSASKLAAAAQQGGANATESLVMGCTILFGLWVFGPLLVGGVDDALDPTKLALLPLTKRELRSGLVGGALIGPLPFATIITLVGIIVGYWHGDARALFAVVGAALVLAFNLTSSRALSVGLAFAGRSRKGKDLAVLLASLCAATLFLGTQAMRFLGPAQKVAILRGMRWLPPGQIASAILEANRRAYLPAAIRLFAVLGIVVGLGRAWMHGIDLLLVDTESVRHKKRKRTIDGLGVIPLFLRRWTAKPVAILIAKELRYLVRSPQRRSSMIISIVIGTVIALMQSMRFSSSNSVSVLGAPIAMLFGVHATNNLLGTDSASLWMEQTAGIKLKDQLIARGIAATPNLFIPSILAAFVLALMTGGWVEFSIICAASMLCWGIPLGVGTLISVIAPFNQPDVGNPYSNKRSHSGHGGLVSVLAIAGIVTFMVAALPVVGVVAIGYFTRSFLFLSVGLVVSTIYSLAIWRLGIWAALRVKRGREVDLLTELGGRRALA